MNLPTGIERNLEFYLRMLYLKRSRFELCMTCLTRYDLDYQEKGIPQGC